MTRFVIDPGVAYRLAEQRIAVPTQHRLFAPTLMRSQVLALLYAAVQRDELTRPQAHQRLDHLRRLRIRWLGDRVLQSTAWDIALELGWQDTFVAEYLALTKLQADALATDSPELAAVARRVVPVVGSQALLTPPA